MSDVTSPEAPMSGGMVLSPLPLGGKRRSRRRTVKLSVKVKRALKSLTKMKFGGDETAVVSDGKALAEVTPIPAIPATPASLPGGRRRKSRKGSKKSRSRKH